MAIFGPMPVNRQRVSTMGYTHVLLYNVLIVGTYAIWRRVTRVTSRTYRVAAKRYTRLRKVMFVKGVVEVLLRGVICVLAMFLRRKDGTRSRAVHVSAHRVLPTIRIELSPVARRGIDNRRKWLVNATLAFLGVPSY